MAFSPTLVLKRFKDLPVEELEKKYKALESEYRFETKDSQIKKMIEGFLHPSNGINTQSLRKGLEILLKEKTGRDYTIEEKYFEIDMNDMLDYLLNNTSFEFDKKTLIEFFDKILYEEEMEKIVFVISLVQCKENFYNFVKEVNQNNDAELLYEQYTEIADEYYSKNHYIS